MYYKWIVGTLVIAFCFRAGDAQQNPAAYPSHPLTYMQKRMNVSKDIAGLEKLYDSLKTEYDRRYFLSGLPGFLTEKRIQSSALSWINSAVVKGLASNDPLCVFNAVNAASALKINCPRELMATYKIVHDKFGSHEEMIKTAILGSMCGLNDPAKQGFLFDILTKEKMPLVGSTFSALVNALETTKSQMYLSKISEISDSLNSLAARLQSADQKSYRLPECMAMQKRVTYLRKELGGKQ
jgi:hypothetical protein